MWKLVAVLVIPCIFAGPAFGQQLVDDLFDAPSIGSSQTYPVRVYEPIDYDPSGPPYRLLIYLHGCCGLNHTSYSGVMKPQLDALIGDGVTGAIEPLIVVWPGITGAAFGNRHLFTNSERNGAFGDVVTEDLVNWIEAHYNVILGRHGRAIGGFSMGADGSIRLAVRHSEKFIAFISNSGGQALWALENWRATVLAEAGSGPPYEFLPGNGPFTQIFFGIASAFSPNLDNPPYDLDFPLDPLTGEWIPSVFDERWIANHDAATLIEDPTVYTTPMHFYFDAGDASDLARPFADLFATELAGLGEPFTYNTFTGGHVLTQQRVAVFLPWLDSVLDEEAVGAPAVPPDQPGHPWVGPNRPNPFAIQTTIPFHMESAGWVQLDLFDVSGRKVARLLNGHYPAGEHRATLRSSGLPAGVYFYRLSGGGGWAANRKMIIAK